MESSMKNEKLTSIKNEELKSFIDDQLSGSSLLALPKIIKTKYISVKLVWIAALLIATGLFIYMVTQNVIEYLQFNVNTKTRSFREYPVLFPALVICNKEPFVTNFSIDYLANMIRNNPSEFPLYNKIAEDIKNNSLELVNFFIKNDTNYIFEYAMNKTIEQNEMRIGYSYDEMVLICKFDSKDCEKSDFEPILIPNYGVCLKYNYKRSFKFLKKIGSLYRLEMTLLIGKSDDFYTIDDTYGVVLYIYNQSNSYSESDKITLSSGTSSLISISKLFKSVQPSPFSDCQEVSDSNSPFYKEFFKRNLTYRMNDCYSACLQSEIFNKCKCYSYSLDNVFEKINYPLCIKEKLDCVSNVTDENENCLQQCPRECDTQSYSIKMYFSIYPSLSVKQYLVQKSRILSDFNSKNESIDGKLLNFQIYFESYYYDLISESPALIIPTLLANIGGLLGLFLGLSLLTFFEIFEIFFELFYKLIEKRKKDYLINKNNAK